MCLWVDWSGRELDKLATPFDKSPGDVEFHASTIFSRREAPWKILTIDDARGILKSVLRVVASSYETARLFACAIHKKSFPNQDPVELAFEDLCQRFDYFLKRLRQQGDQQRGMLIVDKTTRELHFKNSAASLEKPELEATPLRTALEFARMAAQLVFAYPADKTIHLVLDNANIHCRKSLVGCYGEEFGVNLWKRFTVHYKFKHGSWLNQAEIEISIFSRQ